MCFSDLKNLAENTLVMVMARNVVGNYHGGLIARAAILDFCAVGRNTGYAVFLVALSELNGNLDTALCFIRWLYVEIPTLD